MSDFQLFIDSIKYDSDGEIENKFKIDFLEMEDKDSWRPLHHACHYGQVGLVEILLSNHCEIDSFTNNGYQPIHLACKKGHVDIVKILIAKKCEINASDKSTQYQPIHFACRNGHFDVVKVLVANKCNINAYDEIYGYRPIHLACKNGHINIVKLLIENKCDIHTIDKINGYQPIHVACENGFIDIVKTLIENKCEINKSDKIYGYLPIHLACENGYIDIVKILIENQCEINKSDKIYGYQPIHLACEKGYIDIVKILIANKCDFNKPDKIDGYQPLHLACKNGHIDIVKILIAIKCNRNATTKCGESPIDIAYQEGHNHIIDFLINANQIEIITKAMDLHCDKNCDHFFCRQSLEDETFKKGEMIGSRTFWKIYKNKISNTNIDFVIKQTKYNCKDNKYTAANINRFLSRILHKNIVRYFGALEKSRMLCIFMEYIPGGSLKNLIDQSKWIGNPKVIKYTKQILDGLQFLHSQGIIHGDIKPDNMLLDHDETLKLTDFGLCRSLHIESNNETTAKTERFCYTSNYLALEVLLGKPYDFPADIWSTGASIIHMITGKKPYHLLPPESVMFKIVTTKTIEFTPCEPISETLQSFIDDLLTPEQLERPRAESLLKHSIFTNEK